MPFTFAHPAIVLPLRYLPQKWFSLTGLIIGSLTPDFEYFIRMRVKSNYSHTIAGLFWFDLPLAILLCFIFHIIIKNQLFKNLPRKIQQRVLVFTEFNWIFYFKKNWLVVLVSIIIGTASHLFWDSFTHNHGYFVNHISELRSSFFIFDQKIPVLKIAQHVSTCIGGLIILFIFLKIPKTNSSAVTINKSYWFSILLFSSLILLIRFSSGLKIDQYGHLIVSFISSVLISFLLTSTLFNLKEIRKNY